MSRIHIPAYPDSTTVQVQPAQVHTSGQTAGYIELTLQLDGQATREDLHHHLRLGVPGELELLEPTSMSDAPGVPDGVVITFFSAQVSNAGRLPHRIELQWLDDHDTWMIEIPFEQATAEMLPEENEDAELPGN
jgi:hypothetical protein